MLSERLRYAFGTRDADYIVLDGWSPQWQWEHVKSAVNDGLMFFDGEVGSDEAQYTGYRYRLTEAGRQALEESDG